MSSAAMRGLRSRWVGWMRPSVRKVGAVQVATGALAVGALFTGVSWPWWGLALLGYFFYACVGHSVGYHRYFAHRSFRAPRWAEVMFTVAGTLGCVGSPVGWAQMHRRHHRLLGPGRRPLYRAPVSAPEPAGAADERVRLGAGECPRPSPDVPGRPAPGVRDAVLLRHRGRIRRRAAARGLAPVPVRLGGTGCLDAVDGGPRCVGDAPARLPQSRHAGREPELVVVLAPLVGRGLAQQHHANPRAWSYRERWWEWDFGAAVVWAILRQSNQRNGHGAGPMDPVREVGGIDVKGHPMVPANTRNASQAKGMLHATGKRFPDVDEFNNAGASNDS